MYLDTCDGNMQEGSLRADVNISVRKPGDEYGTRCEIKNLNSIKFIKQAINYEVKRQIEVLEEGGVIEQKALYNWLKANSEARACIDSWWREPITHGDFDTEYPFLNLPNFFGSPHNSAITEGAFKKAGYQAAENVKSFLENKNAERLVTLNDQ